MLGQTSSVSYSYPNKENLSYGHASGNERSLSVIESSGSTINTCSM